MRSTLCQMHGCEIHGYETYAFEMHGYEMHGYEMDGCARYMPMRDIRPYEIHARARHTPV